MLVASEAIRKYHNSDHRKKQLFLKRKRKPESEKGADENAGYIKLVMTCLHNFAFAQAPVTCCDRGGTILRHVDANLTSDVFVLARAPPHAAMQTMPLNWSLMSIWLAILSEGTMPS